MKLKIRGHHLLCLKGFQGYGYDENFTKNMIEINEKRKHENTTIILTNECDNICSSCPNLIKNKCENEIKNQKIVDMDNEVLKKLDLKKEYNSIQLFDMINQLFNSKESLCKICSNCIWHEKCLFYQKIIQ